MQKKYTQDVEFISGSGRNITLIKTHFNSASKIHRFKMLVKVRLYVSEIFDLNEIVC